LVDAADGGDVSGVVAPGSLPPLANRDEEEDEEPPQTPSRTELRAGTRMLRERRVKKPGKGPVDSAATESVSAAIRERTQLTLMQAHAQPGSANVFLAREAELQRQRTRLEDVRRTYDLLHAEWVGKEDMRKMLELTLHADKRAPPGASLDDTFAKPAWPSSKQGSPRAVDAGGGRGDADPADLSSLAGLTPLEEISERVRVAQEELREMLYSCEVRGVTWRDLA
jgi:hypothetical protein